MRITGQHADKIAKKLDAGVKSGGAHDMADADRYYQRADLTRFGIRRSSDKNIGHGHVPKNFFLSQAQTRKLAERELGQSECFRMLRDEARVPEIPLSFRFRPEPCRLLGDEGEAGVLGQIDLTVALANK